jgi:hypothetical protein
VVEGIAFAPRCFALVEELRVRQVVQSGLLSRLIWFCYCDFDRGHVPYLSFFAQPFGSDCDTFDVEFALEESSSAHFDDINGC